MKLPERRWIVIVAVILIVFLAIPLRDAVQRLVIVPAAYVIWLFKLVYLYTPQLIWWALAVLLVVKMVLDTFGPGRLPIRRPLPDVPPPQGGVETLARSINKTREGVYFKWLVANRLGRLADRMLALREGRMSRPAFSPLTGAGWEPSAPVQKYLEAGLRGSFSDYPRSSRFRTPPDTPLDLEVEQAVEFLESQLETRRDRNR
jgi:hypothetical protein